MSWVPVFCAAWPTAKKIADLVSDAPSCAATPAKFAMGPPMPKAKVMIPMCSIEE